MLWIVGPRLPFRTAAFPASTGIETVINMRIFKPLQGQQEYTLSAASWIFGIFQLDNRLHYRQSAPSQTRRLTALPCNQPGDRWGFGGSACESNTPSPVKNDHRF